MTIDQVIAFAQQYRAGSSEPAIYSKATVRSTRAETPGYEHLDFYCVGHNATHLFYLASDGTDYYRMSVDSDFSDEEYITKNTGAGYLGHW